MQLNFVYVLNAHVRSPTSHVRSYDSKIGFLSLNRVSSDFITWSSIFSCLCIPPSKKQLPSIEMKINSLLIFVAATWLVSLSAAQKQVFDLLLSPSDRRELDALLNPKQQMDLQTRIIRRLAKLCDAGGTVTSEQIDDAFGSVVNEFFDNLGIPVPTFLTLASLGIDPEDTTNFCPRVLLIASQLRGAGTK